MCSRTYLQSTRVTHRADQTHTARKIRSRHRSTPRQFVHKGATPAPLPCCGKITIRHLAVELLDLLHFRGLLRHSARMRTSTPLTCAHQFRSQSTGYVLELDRSVPALQLKEGRQLRCRVVSSPADSNSRAGTIVPRGKRRQPVEESVTTTGQVPVSVSSQSTGTTTIPSGTCARSSLFGSPRSRWFSAHSDGHTTLRRLMRPLCHVHT